MGSLKFAIIAAAAILVCIRGNQISTVVEKNQRELSSDVISLEDEHVSTESLKWKRRTRTPTKKPVSRPSGTPKSSPVSKPTGAPVPTAQLSSSPSASPTSRSAAPSNTPKSSPSAPPTSPSASPSNTPRSSPSVLPSRVPVARPTSASRFTPSFSPNSIPSPSPTKYTQAPTVINEKAETKTRQPTNTARVIPPYPVGPAYSIPVLLPPDEPTNQPTAFFASQPPVELPTAPSESPVNFIRVRGTKAPTKVPSTGAAPYRHGGVIYLMPIPSKSE